MNMTQQIRFNGSCLINALVHQQWHKLPFFYNGLKRAFKLK